MTTAPSPLLFLWSEPTDEPLAILIRRKWLFLPGFDSEGQLDRVTGQFIWDVDGFVDALRVKSQTDAAAMRVQRGSGVVWDCNGTAAEVLQRLVELPAPSDRLAPRLVVAAAPRLWTP
ncbi:hypothetical protein VA596_47245 [Amycolatopsis sp., V23-08]|uniref:DUF2442 domain-containing protein n=1 Tax=Amycolatopsis heterodermiae TaxID=3110235 RepID=A0ABU5RP00_9PSEU|nr:hypothetical protein [Amycolatopsis sp., V23-08]MEA5367195.1 hypothetical protein [Amycolatopsis sp., V23-08]